MSRAGDDKAGAEARWNRARKQRICLRIDVEVVDWFKSQGSWVPDADEPGVAKSDDGGEEEEVEARWKSRAERTVV